MRIWVLPQPTGRIKAYSRMNLAVGIGMSDAFFSPIAPWIWTEDNTSTLWGKEQNQTQIWVNKSRSGQSWSQVSDNKTDIWKTLSANTTNIW
jgi:hypothetical protein